MATVTPEGKVTLKMRDSSDELVTEYIGYVHVDVNNTDTATVTLIDTFARNIRGLTTNTLIDTTVTYEYSLGDILG